MRQNDIKKQVEKFEIGISPTERYASFDFCFNLFQSGEYKKDIEKSCYALGFYLASWGMLRGSSFLLGKSAKYYEKLIKYYAGLDQSYWKIDIDSPSEEYIDKTLELYHKTKENIIVSPNTTHLTLITKILLGVFGCIPAFDTFFVETFRNIYKGNCAFSSVSKKSLNYLKSFYQANKEDINEISSSIYTIDFHSERKTLRNYTKAKIVDMYGFAKSNIKEDK